MASGSGSGVGMAGGGCVFQRARCMGVHFLGSYFMSLPLQVLTAPEVGVIATIISIHGQRPSSRTFCCHQNRRRRRTSSFARSARWRPCRRSGSSSRTRPFTGTCRPTLLCRAQQLTRPTKFPPSPSALLVACIRGGETNCHRSDAVRLMKELTALGMKPNAITYGQYTRAIAEGAFVPFLIRPLPPIPIPTPTQHPCTYTHRLRPPDQGRRGPPRPVPRRPPSPAEPRALPLLPRLHAARRLAQGRPLAPGPPRLCAP